MSVPRLLSEAELAGIRAWIAGLPSTGTGRLPDDLSLLIGHVDAQAADLKRVRQHTAALRDAVDDLIDVIEHGGDTARQDDAVARARHAQAGS